MPKIGIAELIERIEQERNQLPLGTKALLAFDADNTFWSGDVGVDLFEDYLETGHIHSSAATALDKLAQKSGIAPGKTPAETARVLYESWENQLSPSCPEDETFAMMAWIYAGMTPDAMVSYAYRVLTQKGIANRIRKESRELLAWARDRSVEVLIVSASPHGAVEAGVRYAGVPASSVFAMTPKVEHGVLCPELTGTFTYGEGKAAAVRERRPGAVLLAGFGDSAYDGALMRLSKVPVAITPSAGLLGAAPDIPGLVELIVT